MCAFGGVKSAPLGLVLIFIPLLNVLTMQSADGRKRCTFPVPSTELISHQLKYGSL